MRTMSSHLLIRLSTVILALTLSLPARAGADCTIGWSVVSSPNGGDLNSLSDLAVVTANDIWAVGETGNGFTPELNTLIEHWNGSSWAVIPSPNGTFPVNYLNSVSAVSSTDVWAVGYTFNGIVSDSKSRTLILHWNGSVWNVVPSPNTSSPENRLKAVVAISANDVWAVGDSYDYTNFRTLTMHWNGSAWSIVPSPNPGSFNMLNGVDAVSSNNVWAVGTQQEFLEQTLVLHWDGTSWKMVPSPNVGPFGNNMLHVSAASANDVWAVGYHLTVVGFDQPYQTSAFHYDGTSWKIVSTPNVNQKSNYLWDVVGLGANDAWAVGFWDTGNAYLTMIQHWNGSTWTIVPSPSPNPYTNELYGVAAVSASDIWAVGRTSDGFVTVDTFVERYTNACSNTLHVADIKPFAVPAQRGFSVGADITIVDSSGTAVPDAAVTVRVTLPSGRTVQHIRVTAASGVAKLSLATAQKGTYTFTVINVTRSGWAYDPGANAESSDSIVVN